MHAEQFDQSSTTDANLKKISSSAVFEPFDRHSNINDAYIRTLQAKADSKRTRIQLLADWLTEHMGNMNFLILNLILFALWIALNVGIIPGLQPFDPFPFSFLTMAVSLEAIVISIVVLISQNRESRVSALRAEVDLHIDAKAEEELTKLLQMVALLLQKHGIDTSQDQELAEMLKPTLTDQIEDLLEDQIVNKMDKQRASST